MHGIYQIMLGYFDLFIIIIYNQSDIKLHNNLLNENICLKSQLIKTTWVIFEDNQFMSKHTFHKQTLLIYLFKI